MKNHLGSITLGAVLICLLASCGLMVLTIPAVEGQAAPTSAPLAEVSPADVQPSGQGTTTGATAPQAQPTGSGVVVAILDTGIDGDHEDLAATVEHEVNLGESPSAADLHGHGTHIAGIIAASAGNGIGIDGIAPSCSLMNVKVTNDRGKCHSTTVAQGIVWAVNEGAQVINISLCLTSPSTELEEAISYAWSQGAVIVAAAGNDGDSAPLYPAYYPECIAVTAAKDDGSRAPLANFGDWVDVAAPGYQVYSLLPDDQYGYKTGTSQAVAHVSGLATLLYSVATDTNGDGRVNDEVRAALEGSCQGLIINGMGNGLVDRDGAIALIER